MNEYFMREALKEARKAYELNEVPVGAVIVRNGEIVGRGYNKRETEKLSISHAEINAIIDASKTLGGWRLTNCDIYVTLEPCLMCAGAIYQAKINNVYYGATDKRYGALDSLFRVYDAKLNHEVNTVGGLLEEECSIILSEFFKKIRSKV